MKTILLQLLLLVPLLAGTKTVTDVLGNRVDVPVGAKRILITDGRYINAMALLDRDNPVKNIVGMMGTFERFDPVTYGRYRELYPEIDSIQRIGRNAKGTFSLETALSLQPDVAILGLSGHGPDPKSGEVISALKASGTAVVYIDFRHKPLENTPKSMKILGTILNKQVEAGEYLRFYDAELSKVSSKLSGVKSGPTVFLESRVGLKSDCCETMVNGMMGRFLSYLKANNIAAPLVPGVVGTISVEYLLEKQPEYYILTAIGSSSSWAKSGYKVVTGTNTSKQMAKSSLEQALSRTLLPELSAVKEKRAYGIWHHFYDSPYNVVAIQVLAKWLYPELFKEIDPEATFATLRKFLPVNISGTYWVGLDE